MALSDKKIKQLKADFEAGEISLTKVCKKHKVARTTLYRLAKTAGWKRRAPKKKQVSGRYEKYKPEYIEQAHKLCLLGLVDKELADFFEVSESTLNLWKKKHPEFSESLKKGKVMADAEIAESLHSMAKGYDTKIEKVTKKGDIVELTIHIPAHPISQIFWLKNRQPGKWRDKQEVDGKVEMQIGKITKEDAQVVKDLFDGITE